MTESRSRATTVVTMTQDPPEDELESLSDEMLDAEFDSAREAQGRVTLTIY